ncbi:plexin-A2 [Ciona intestinalis]
MWSHLIVAVLLVNFISNTNCVIRNVELQLTASNLSSQIVGFSVCPQQGNGQTNLEFQQSLLSGGDLYVGATNQIIRLFSHNLTLNDRVAIGPGNDSTDCTTAPFCDQSPCGTTVLSCMENYVHLMIKYRYGFLTCGTLYEACQMLNSSTLQEIGNLQCANMRPSLRDKAAKFVAAIHETAPSNATDILYTGGKNTITVYRVPSSANPTLTAESFKPYVEDMAPPTRTFLLAWTTPTHAYILWRQSGIPSKTMLARYCHASFIVTGQDQNSNGARSYTETEIRCERSGSSYTEPIHAFHANGTLYVLMNQTGSYIICSTAVTALNSHIEGARRDCYSGLTPNAELFNNNVNCGNYTHQTSWLTCEVPEGDFDFIGSVRSLQAMQMRLEMPWPVSKMENPISFVATKVNGHAVVFIGTDRGTIEKVRFGNPSPVIESILTQSNDAVLEINNDNANKQVIGMTKNQIVTFGYSDCHRQYSSCSSCLLSRDPYCGWCVLSSSCTNKESCSNSQSSSRWVEPDSPVNHCPTIVSVSPTDISVSTVTKINLTLGGNPLPSNLGSPYICKFSVSGNTGLIPSSNLDAGNRCTVTTTSAAIIPTGYDHYNVTLQLMYNGNIVTSSIFRIYDCSRIKDLNPNSMCTSCVNAPQKWGCVWCNNPYTCTHQQCGSAASQVSASTNCSLVRSVASPTVAISVGQLQDFQLATSNLKLGVSYRCQFSFCGSTQTSPAVINISSMIASCSISPQQFQCPKKEFPIRVALITGDYVIDSTSVTANSVQGFNCSAQSLSCGQCVSFHENYTQCAWCENKCKLTSACTTSPTTTIHQCGSPQITSVSPLSGPLEGGTILTIRGNNLASRVEQITSVMVGSIPCIVIENSYLASLQFNCRTGRSIGEMVGAVIINTSYSSIDAVFTDQFIYKNVTAKSFNPLQVLNLTDVDVLGSNLDVGNEAKLCVFTPSENKMTTCSNRTRNLLKCKLPSVMRSGKFTLQLKIDGFVRNFSQQIEFVYPPTIQGNQPAEFFGFKTGKGTLTLTLSGLAGVRTVELQIDNGVITPCAIGGNTTITCIIEPDQSARRKRNVNSPSKPGRVLLNNVHTVWEGTIKYVADPAISQIAELPCKHVSGSIQETSNVTSSEQATFIIIPGVNLNTMNPKPSDYKIRLVTVDGGTTVACVVAYVTSTSLVCSAVSSQLDTIRSEKVAILVSYGNWSLPSVQAVYCRQSNTINIVIAVVVPILCLLLLTILLLMLRQRKRAQKRAKEKRVILGKLDELENRTRETARNAYFELQAGYMTNLNENLSHRIIYLPPWEYITQVLFNQRSGHPVLDENAMVGQGTVKQDALKSLLSVIKNKDVLLVLVRTLEEQRKFTVQEKGNMASLLTICLFDDLPYYTRVMLELLTGLIQKHVSRNPKLLLRRSESVVEKMVSHWLSINLYDECINEQAGKPLFLLTKAVHYLVSSAPCDVIAKKAFNSLNEMTLLGTELQYETMVLHATIVEEGGKVTTPVDVKVVNVDSIKQAKTKIIEAVYKDKPYSECPKPDDLDFALMNSSESTGITLSDVDGMSVIDGKYTKINTLKHYNVPDNAVVVLRPHDVENQAPQDVSSPLLPPKHMYHLINPSEEEQSNGYTDVHSDAGKKADEMLDNLMKRPFQEMFLTRMVKAKTTIQEYVDGVFNSILRPKPISTTVRYFFQFLDREAERHKINDPEVLHIWKTNSLLLRYWVNVLKNPEFVFDLNKTDIVDSCLNVITQAFMDACTTTNRKLGHDSPSNKLLYAKDADNYKVMVKEFFINISNTPTVTQEEVTQILQKQSASYASRFNQMVALNGIYEHLAKYREQVMEALSTSDNEVVRDVGTKLDEIFRRMGGERNSNTTVV